MSREPYDAVSPDDPPVAAPRQVGVVIYGFGTVGQAILDLCLQRPFIDVRAVIARSPEKVGRPAGAFVTGAPDNLLISGDASDTLRAALPDVVLLATQSRVADVLPQLRLCAEHGARVISTSEELAFAEAFHPDLATQVRTIARENNVAILATGVNPGFVFDALPLTLASAAWDVDQISVRRVLDASVFGQEVQRHLGIGYTEEQFHRAVRAAEIWGHIGFPESAAMLCRKMGKALERVEQVLDPILARQDYELRDWRVPAGRSVGVNHRATGWVDGSPWLAFEVVLHVMPSDMGWAVRDEITVAGSQSMSLVLEPGCHAIRTTAARIVNSIPEILLAAPGLYTPVDLPPSGPWLGQTLPWH